LLDILQLARYKLCCLLALEDELDRVRNDQFERFIANFRFRGGFVLFVLLRHFVNDLLVQFGPML
jgi:hypothetical protein